MYLYFIDRVFYVHDPVYSVLLYTYILCMSVFVCCCDTLHILFFKYLLLEVITFVIPPGILLIALCIECGKNKLLKLTN